MCSMHAFFHRTVFNCSPLSPHLFSQSGQYGDCYFERWDGVLNCSMARLMKILPVDVHPTYVVQLILIRSGKMMSGIVLMACHMYCRFHFGIVFLLTLKKLCNFFSRNPLRRLRKQMNVRSVQGCSKDKFPWKSSRNFFVYLMA